MLITIFTPTYNRAKYIEVLYNSLLQQTIGDFEWIIVDDGSSDQTKETVDHIIKEGLIKTRYWFQENSGKHVAINKGAEMANGELFFTVDSDDYLVPEALEVVAKTWEDVQQLPKDKSEKIIGVGANCIFPNGDVIGGSMPFEICDTDLLDLRFIRKIKGDKTEIYKTDVIKSNPFPVIQGETFCPEALIFYRLANDGYKLRFINRNIRVCEYLPDGLSLGAFNTLKRGPRASIVSTADILWFKNIPLLIKLKFAILFWRFQFFENVLLFSEKVKLLPSFWWILFYPAGLIMHIRDRSKI